MVLSEGGRRPWMGLDGESLQIFVNHHLDEAFEGHFGLPAEDSLRLRGVADQMVDFGRPKKRPIGPDVLLPLEPGVSKRDLDKVLD